jgi:hypothetical protein
MLNGYFIYSFLKSDWPHTSQSSYTLDKLSPRNHFSCLLNVFQAPVVSETSEYACDSELCNNTESHNLSSTIRENVPVFVYAYF